MARWYCDKCGRMFELGMFEKPPSTCPECGFGKMITPAAFQVKQKAQLQRSSIAEAAAKYGATPYEWKVVGGGGFWGVAGSDDLEKALGKLSAEGWEFVFALDGQHLVSSSAPAFIFKRRILEEEDM